MSIWDDVNDRDNPLPGAYLVEVTDVEIGRTKGGPNAKLPEGCKMYILTYEILEPADFAGMTIRDRFAVGRKDDEDCLQAKTRSDPKNFAIKSLKRMLKAAQAPLLEDMDASVQAAQGNRLMIKVKTQTNESGYENVNVSRYGQIGAFPPVVVTEGN